MRIPFDIIDILLMAYIIYKAIGFMRETRAGQLAKGLVILFVIYFVANWWDLTTMKWVLSRFVDYIIVAIAIIFQPELRRILERVGHTKLVSQSSSNPDDDPLENCLYFLFLLLAFLHAVQNHHIEKMMQNEFRSGIL